jgi:hypothetical protein
MRSSRGSIYGRGVAGRQFGKPLTKDDGIGEGGT